MQQAALRVGDHHHGRPVERPLHELQFAPGRLARRQRLADARRRALRAGVHGREEGEQQGRGDSGHHAAARADALHLQHAQVQQAVFLAPHRGDLGPGVVHDPLAAARGHQAQCTVAVARLHQLDCIRAEAEFLARQRAQLPQPLLLFVVVPGEGLEAVDAADDRRARLRIRLEVGRIGRQHVAALAGLGIGEQRQHLGQVGAHLVCVRHGLGRIGHGARTPGSAEPGGHRRCRGQHEGGGDERQATARHAASIGQAQTGVGRRRSPCVAVGDASRGARYFKRGGAPRDGSRVRGRGPGIRRAIGA
jgi:hypothetical protein